MILNRKTLTWLLNGVAFLAVITTAGCSSRPAAKLETGATFVAADAEALESPELDIARDTDSPAPSINIFGEFDGVERGAVSPVGEAGFQQHTYLEEGFDADISVDPTGTWMTFASTRHSEKTDVYLQRIGGTSVTQLTADGADDAFPVFSPDGRRIAFCSTRGGTWDIYVMDLDGRNAVQITSGPSQDIHPSFSPDATKLVYSSMSPRSDQWEMWVVNLLTGEKQMIGFGLFPSWSPAKDVNRIAFQRARQRGSRWFSLWTLDLIDGEARFVTEVAVSTNAAIVSPTWSPDGRKLAFTTIVDPATNSGGKSRGQHDVWMIDADGRNRQRLTDGKALNLSPHWASDNRIYFISDRSGQECVWSVKAAAIPASVVHVTEQTDEPAHKTGAHAAPDTADAHTVAPHEGDALGSIDPGESH